MTQTLELRETNDTLPPPNSPKSRRWTRTYTPGQPDPWLQRYVGVIILLALTIWSFYVVVGRVCTPMIQGRSTTGLGVGVGAGTLVIFIVLWLLYVWSYLSILVRGPGFARKVVPKCGPPHTAALPLQTGPLPNDEDQQLDRPTHDSLMRDPAGPDPPEFSAVTNTLVQQFQRPSSQEMSTTTLTPSAAPRTTSKGLADWRSIPRPVPQVIVGPRWCQYCQINKPDRTHHCRHCGTCVMQFDHHCLWIGQCVGWANHKFFMTFTFWAAVFCAYIVILQVICLTRSADVDGQVIGLTAVAAMFFLFSIMMYISHVYLILTGKSTVESYKGRDQHDAEEGVLNKEYGYLWHNQEKRKVRKRWKEEWGDLPVDARWRHSGPLTMWKQEMGSHWLGWILPVGRPLGDGITFPSNARFGPNGEWLMKRDWPKGIGL